MRTFRTIDFIIDMIMIYDHVHIFSWSECKI